MKKCLACRVNVSSPLVHCPLCYSNLVRADDQAEPQSYPDLSGQVEVYNLMLRVLVFLSVSVGAIAVVVNLMTPLDFPWSLIIIASIAYVWTAVGTAIRRHAKIGFNLMIQMISLGILLLVLGILLGFRQSVFDYIIPALVASGILSFNILAIIRKTEIQNFLIYFLIVALLGFIPLILLGLGVSKVVWPAVACGMFSGLSIVSVFLFAGSATWNELRKRFNI